MSKGEIVQHLGDAKYRVRQKLAVERVQEELAAVALRLAQLAIAVPTKKLELLQAEDGLRSKAQEIDLLIPDLQAGIPGAREEITKRQSELVVLQSSASQLRWAVAELIADELANRKRQNQLQQVPEDREFDVWCADYTEDLTGDVGLVDVNDEGGGTIVVQPGFGGSATYQPSRDGAIFPDLAQSGPQIYFNRAILPGVQKWRPRYRIGVIGNITNDLCNVTLEPAASSAQDLNINQADTLIDVPIQYMDCNAAAFEDGDRVVVRFTKSGPLVIGFATNPKSCLISGISFLPALRQGSSLVTYGEPFIDPEEQEINPPLGSASGANPRWVITPSSDPAGYSVQKGGQGPVAGNRNWRGPTAVLSWDGPVSRVYNHRLEEQYGSVSPWHDHWQRSGRVYSKSNVLVDLATQSTGAFNYVCGAGIRQDQSQDYLYVVAAETAAGINQTYQVFRWTLSADRTTVGASEFVQQIASPPNTRAVSDFYFSADGNAAVCTFVNDKSAPEDPDNDSLVYRVRYNALVGFVETQLIWDRFAEPVYSNVNTEDKIYTISRHGTEGECGSRKLGPSLIEHIQRGMNGSGAGYSIPIYIDYVGNEEVAVYYSVPASNEATERDLKYTEFTREYPNPCAGEPDRPAMIQMTIASENNRTLQSANGFASPRQIINSKGKVLAEEKIRELREESFDYLFEREVGSSGGCGNTFNYDNRSYNFGYQLSSSYGGWLDTMGVAGMVIDARSELVSGIEEYYQENVSATLSGIDPMDDAVFVAGEYQLDAQTPGSSSTSLRLSRTFIGGELVDEVELEREEFVITSRRFRRSIYWQEELTGLFTNECDGSATSNNSTPRTFFAGPQFMPVAKQRFLEGACIKTGGRTAASVLLRNGSDVYHQYQLLGGAPGQKPAGLFDRPLDAPYLMHRLTIS